MPLMPKEKMEQVKQEPQATAPRKHDLASKLIASEGYQLQDGSPSLLAAFNHFSLEVIGEPWARASLVFRDANSGEVQSTVGLNLPLGIAEKDDRLANVTRLSSRIQYSADGDEVYLGANGVLLAVNPKRKQLRLVGAPVVAPVISPDGKQAFAVTGESTVGFIQLDGSRALFIAAGDVIKQTAFQTVGWWDNDTIVMLASDDRAKHPLLVWIASDGILKHAKELPIKYSKERIQELAIAPDRKHIAITANTGLYVLNEDGEVLAHREGISVWNPTFSHDSKQVACWVGSSEREDFVSSRIAFFSLEGNELFWVDVGSHTGSPVKAEPMREEATSPVQSQ